MAGLGSLPLSKGGRKVGQKEEKERRGNYKGTEGGRMSDSMRAGLLRINANMIWCSLGTDRVGRDQSLEICGRSSQCRCARVPMGRGSAVNPVPVRWMMRNVTRDTASGGISEGLWTSRMPSRSAGRISKGRGEDLCACKRCVKEGRMRQKRGFEGRT